MHKLPPSGLACLLLIATACAPWHLLASQQPEQSGRQSSQPIARTSATEVRVTGAVDLSQGEMLLGNGSTVTAGSQPVKIALTRGGQLRLCSTTSLHLSKDSSIDDPQNTALMMALDRGALEANYTVGKYSDVLLTPDLRILISGPGEANLSIRLNTQGDTCVDNHGADAPYLTVSSQLEGGVYRVMPNQRVTFEHGSLREVVDHEAEPCGCPAAPTTSVAAAGIPSNSVRPAHPGQPVGGPSSTAADTAFPLAESEGLAPPPPPSTQPVVPAGEAHAQVTVPLTYDGENPPASGPGAQGLATPSVHSSAAQGSAGNVAAEKTSLPASALSTPVTSAIQNKPRSHSTGFFHSVGHFFARMFGK